MRPPTNTANIIKTNANLDRKYSILHYNDKIKQYRPDHNIYQTYTKHKIDFQIVFFCYPNIFKNGIQKI